MQEATRESRGRDTKQGNAETSAFAAMTVASGMPAESDVEA